MLSPVFRKIFDKILFVCSNTGIYNTHYCSLLKMAELNWREVKQKMLKMTDDERRKLDIYKNIKVVTLNKVDPWVNFIGRNPSIEKKKFNLDDLTEFKRFKINNGMNKILAQRVSIFKGDITKLEVNAIVNAANSMLRAGGGVDGAIHRAAGPLLQEECNTLGGCPTGHAKITGGYNLPARYVIHTVGPQDGSAAKLQECYENCLNFRSTHRVNSIAFPCISTGIYGFPNRLAAHIALRTTRKYVEEHDDMERVIFCLFKPIDVDIYETLMQMYFPVHDWNYTDEALDPQ